MQASDSPLIFGFRVEENNQITRLAWTDVINGFPISDGHRCWLHFDRRHPDAEVWLRTRAELDEIVMDSLIREDTRPRATRHDEGWLVNLRGVNFNSGPQEDVMIALRIWATGNLVITTRALKIRAAEDLANKFLAGEAPETNGGIIAFLADKLVCRLEPVVEDLADQVDDMDERVADGEIGIMRSDLAKLRRHAIAIRRYMAPQREALNTLNDTTGDFLHEEEHYSLRETLNALLRISEELDSIRDRAQIIQEQIAEFRAEAMNQRLFVLSIISAVFLPLGFVTGLFGVNVGGMPGVGSHIAFGLLCLGLMFTGAGLLWLFRRIGWM